MPMPKKRRSAIAFNIKRMRHEAYPGRGGGQRCAKAFGVTPQQWSPWETGVRTPTESRLEDIAIFFGTTLEELRRIPEDFDEQENAADQDSVDMQKSVVEKATDAPVSPAPREQVSDNGLAEYYQALTRLMNLAGGHSAADMAPVLHSLADFLEEATKRSDFFRKSKSLTPVSPRHRGRSVSEK